MRDDLVVPPLAQEALKLVLIGAQTYLSHLVVADSAWRANQPEL